MGTLENRAIAERHWEFMYAKDWDGVASQFAPDAEYMDIGAVPPAVGPRAIHVEEWHFHTGEMIPHPFTSVMRIRDGLIHEWHDYSHLNNLLDKAPQWWIEYIMSGGTTPIPGA